MMQNLSMVRGDSASFNFEFENESAVTLESAEFIVSASYDDNESALFVKDLTDGIQSLGDNLYVVRIAPSDTEGADAGLYYYDFTIGVNGDVFTLLHGVLRIEADVRR